MKKLTLFFIVALLALFSLFFATGCKTAEIAAENLGDEAKSGTVVVTAVKVKSSDALSSGAPVGEGLVVIGSIESIPVKAKEKEQILCYAKIETVKSPNFFSSGYTETSKFVFTFKNADDAQKILDIYKEHNKALQAAADTQKAAESAK